MDIRPPLHLHLLAHPKSEDGQRVRHGADAPLRRSRPRAVDCASRCSSHRTEATDLPPRLDTPEGLDLEAAQHTIVVVLGGRAHGTNGAQRYRRRLDRLRQERPRTGAAGFESAPCPAGSPG